MLSFEGVPPTARELKAVIFHRYNAAQESYREMRAVKVVPHNPAWAHHFRKAATELCTAFGAGLLALYHIGSTAIPGMPAKPVIDIMPVVRDIERVAGAVPALMHLGYEPRGEYGIAGRRYFIREVAGRRTHHVHVYERDHPAVIRHLVFRDYLIAHPDEAGRYAELKVRLAARHGDERHVYVEGKAPLIAELERKAIAWQESEHCSRRRAGAEFGG